MLAARAHGPLAGGMAGDLVIQLLLVILNALKHIVDVLPILPGRVHALRLFPLFGQLLIYHIQRFLIRLAA